MDVPESREATTTATEKLNEAREAIGTVAEYLPGLVERLAHDLPEDSPTYQAAVAAHQAASDALGHAGEVIENLEALEGYLASVQ